MPRQPSNCFVATARILPLLAALLNTAPPAGAELSYGPISFNAFGTLGGAWLSNEHVNYMQTLQPVGPGLTHDFDIGIDSRLGAQLNVTPLNGTSITAQSVVERLPDNTFQPRLTLANIRQEIGDHLTVRIGRIQSPLFMASDYRLANFANPWVRTPGMLYNIYPLTHIDSGEATYRLTTDLGTLSLNAGYGWLDYSIPISANSNQGRYVRERATISLDDATYANLKLENGPWRFKLSWLHTRLSSNIEELNRLLVKLAPFDPSAARQMRYDHRGVSLFGAGFAYDAADWLVMAEWGGAYTDEAFAFTEKHGGYLTVGYRIDRWLPQLTFGYQATTDFRVHSAIPPVDTAIATLHDLQRTDYRSLALGLNYAATDSIMLRGQLDLIEPMRHSNGPYFLADDRYQRNDPDIDAMVTLSLDFVF